VNPTAPALNEGNGHIDGDRIGVRQMDVTQTDVHPLL
jgi:hypothetical protein